ncbi:hypothetical protein [Deinococcus peraridilitoris]|nr:hypothetical protein [Deinococcus peraridilitoris]
MKKTLIVSVILGMTTMAFAQTGTTTTTTTTTQTQPAAPATQATGQLSAEQYFARAQEQAVQAEVAYPVAFVDRTLWKAAVTDASMAAMAEPDNREYRSYSAQLYTKTQWWINAYNAWRELGELTEAERDLAALSAAKLGYLALQRGDRDTARTYVTQGMQWRNTQSLQDLMRRL